MLMHTFANNLVNNYKSRSDFIKDLIKSRSSNKFDGPLNIIKKLFGKKENDQAALLFDYIKEISSGKEFDYFCKPDGHLIDVFNALYGEASFKKNMDYVKRMDEIIDDLHKYPKYAKVTAYTFDRMLYIICSGNFFLDNIKNTKDWFVSKL